MGANGFLEQAPERGASLVKSKFQWEGGGQEGEARPGNTMGKDPLGVEDFGPWEGREGVPGPALES